jgi:hypothetical protein
VNLQIKFFQNIFTFLKKFDLKQLYFYLDFCLNLLNFYLEHSTFSKFVTFAITFFQKIFTFFKKFDLKNVFFILTFEKTILFSNYSTFLFCLLFPRKMTFFFVTFESSQACFFKDTVRINHTFVTFQLNCNN